MRELLLRDGKFNWNFIVPLFLSDLTLHTIRFIQSNSSYDSPVSYKAYSFVSYAIYPLIWVMIWAFVLKHSGTGKTKAVLLPTLALFIFATLFNELNSLLYNATTSGAAHSRDTWDYLIALLNAVVVCALCELLYPYFRNKLLLFLGVGLVASLGYQVVFFLKRPDIDIRYAMITSLTVYTLYDYFLTMFFIKLLRATVPVDLSLRKQEMLSLKKRIQEEMSNMQGLPALIAKMRSEFPSMPLKKITRVYTETTDLETQSGYKKANAILVIVMLFSAVYAMVTTPFRPYLSFGYFNIDDVGYFLLSIIGLPFILLRLKIAGDLLLYRPYTYRLLLIAGIIGCCNSLVRIGSGSPGLRIIEFIAYAAIAWLAYAISAALYPDYGLIFKRKFSREELGESPATDVTLVNQ